MRHVRNVGNINVIHYMHLLLPYNMVSFFQTGLYIPLCLKPKMKEIKNIF